MMSHADVPGPASVHPATASIHPPAPALRTAPLLATLGAAVVVGSVAAVVYVARGIQREMAARTNLLRTYHEEEVVRAAASVDPSETAGALEVTSNPPGSGIWINGAARTEVTPVTLDKLPIGKELNVKIAKEGYETFRSTLRLTDESPFKLVAAEMKPMPATVVLHVDPPLVNMWVDGKLWKGDHTSIAGLSTGVEHWLLFAAAGYEARMASVTPDPGGVITLTVHLQKAGAPR